MQHANSTPPPIPPPLPPASRAPGPAMSPPGDDPAEREPIRGVSDLLESILREPRRMMHALGQPGAWRLVMLMVALSGVCAAVYGLVVGTFSRGDQLWIAPLKILLGLWLTALICLPSLYLFGCLSGSRARLNEMAGWVAAMGLLVTLLLLGFAPVSWLFSESTNSLRWMGALHLSLWTVATLFGLRLLRAGFIRSQARSRAGLAVWSIVFVLVAFQMTTALRPILGTADTFLPGEKKFFLQHWVDSAAGPTGADAVGPKRREMPNATEGRQSR